MRATQAMKDSFAARTRRGWVARSSRAMTSFVLGGPLSRAMTRRDEWRSPNRHQIFFHRLLPWLIRRHDAIIGAHLAIRRGIERAQSLALLVLRDRFEQ